jgi:PAS domain S-box-containing protein
LTNQTERFHFLLLVESESDAELILLELRREELQFSARRVCTEADFLSELRHCPPDLVVADYSLPSCGGVSALRFAQAERPGVPFIVLFGALDAEMAVDALQQGATDCVAKERPRRLGPVARRALLEVEERRQRQQAEEALRASEHNYREIFNATHDAIFVHDPVTGEILNVNQAMLDMFGYSREELPSLTVEEVFGPIAPYSHEEAIRRIRLAVAKGPQVFEWESKRRNGERFWAEVVLRSTRIDGKECVLAVGRDITARKQAEDALRQKEEYYRALIENASDVISVINADGTIRYESPSVEQVFGYRPDELLGANCFDLVHPEDAVRIRAIFADRIAKPLSDAKDELRFRHKDGSWRTVEVCGRNLISDRSVKGLVVHSRDVTERKLSEQQLVEHQHQLQSLAAELSRAEQRERRRLATLLHDDVIQCLALSSIKLGTLLDSLPGAEQKVCVRSIRSLIEQAIQSTRSLTFQLSPPILHELGLDPALDWLTEQFAKQHSLPCQFTCDAQPKPLAEDLAEVLFTAARELLVNIVKHAQATEVEVNSCLEGDGICIRVTDNGVGFDPAAMANRVGKTGGFGLVNIRERLGYLGGSCDLQSKPGHGTRVALRAPLRP